MFDVILDVLKAAVEFAAALGAAAGGSVATSGCFVTLCFAIFAVTTGRPPVRLGRITLA